MKEAPRGTAGAVFTCLPTTEKCEQGIWRHKEEKNLKHLNTTNKQNWSFFLWSPSRVCLVVRLACVELLQFAYSLFQNAGIALLLEHNNFLAWLCRFSMLSEWSLKECGNRTLFGSLWALNNHYANFFITKQNSSQPAKPACGSSLTFTGITIVMSTISCWCCQQSCSNFSG